MLENYEKYLKDLDEKLSKLFENQKDYVFCKKGCAKCCKNADFPYSKIELLYLMYGFQKLEKTLKDKIRNNIEKLKQQKDRKVYDCPFLIDDVCSVYDYRGIVCRTFGLLEKTDDDVEVKIPFCSSYGLNYSNAFDKTTKEIFYTDNVISPTAFDVSYKTLTDKEYEWKYGINFGISKSLIEWFIK